ncbi:MAG: hypothetical protein IBJ11_09510, partial [Phycisphaerales bacterium]|nr:hypothetical protein [Phycisphaerales bacterium]
MAESTPKPESGRPADAMAEAALKAAQEAVSSLAGDAPAAATGTGEKAAAEALAAVQAALGAVGTGSGA